MKVILQIRPDVEGYPGGDFIQLLKTQSALERLGVRAALSFSPLEDLRSCDLVHLFNVTRIADTYLFYRNAKRQGKKVAISPIYHSLRDMASFYSFHYRLPFFHITGYLALKEAYYAMRARSGFSLKCITAYTSAVREVLTGCDIVLPNSSSEMQSIIHELGILSRFKIVPNGADICFPEGASRRKRENLILCIGRIEPRKNQIAVIDAFVLIKESLPDDTKLVFFGALNTNHLGYVRKFEKRVQRHSEEISYRGAVLHEEILAVMERARLLVLASFFETTGLVGLEALSGGAGVLMTDRGYTKEYFSGQAMFCNPYSVQSIAEGMIGAFRKSCIVDRETVANLSRTYSWENAARLTLDAYSAILKT